MRLSLSIAAVAAALAAATAATPVARPGEPEAIVARPADTDRARGYWDFGRMAGATEMLPAVLDPVTREPVGAS